jgi:hypothetical protein
MRPMCRCAPGWCLDYGLSLPGLVSLRRNVGAATGLSLRSIRRPRDLSRMAGFVTRFADADLSLLPAGNILTLRAARLTGPSFAALSPDRRDDRAVQDHMGQAFIVGPLHRLAQRWGLIREDGNDLVQVPAGGGPRNAVLTGQKLGACATRATSSWAGSASSTRAGTRSGRPCGVAPDSAACSYIQQSACPVPPFCGRRSPATGHPGPVLVDR